MAVMRRAVWLGMVLLLGTGTLRGWAAPPSPAATQNDVARLEALLDEVDRLDGEIAAVTNEQAAAVGPRQRQHLQEHLDVQTAKRADLAAQIETLLPAFPKLRQEWRRRQTVEQSQAVEGRLDDQLKRHDSVLERNVNTRLNKR